MRQREEQKHAPPLPDRNTLGHEDSESVETTAVGDGKSCVEGNNVTQVSSAGGSRECCPMGKASDIKALEMTYAVKRQSYDYEKLDRATMEHTESTYEFTDA